MVRIILSFSPYNLPEKGLIADRKRNGRETLILLSLTPHGSRG